MPAHPTSVPSDCIPFTAIPHTSQLFRDFLYDFERVQRFYSYPPRQRDWLPKVAGSLHYDQRRRDAVAAILERQNRAVGASEQTLASIQRLRTGAAAAVTGQQVALFGGPLFSLLKALTAVCIAEQARAQGVDCVPVFWLATEDHDLVEVNHTTLFTAEGEREKLITESQGAPNAPISDVRLGPEIEAVVARAAELLGDTDIAGLLKTAYRSGETLGSAFAKLFAALFGEFGVILLDASDPELHAIAQPVYRAAVLGAEEIDNALLARGKELRAAGYHEQVKVTPATTLLFEKRQGTREVIHRRNGGFVVGHDVISRDDLLAQIAAEPQRFSANVLLRPVVQDYLLPTIAYTGGPAEVAYFAQTAVVYEEVLGRTTPVLPRFSATLLDARAQRLFGKYHASLTDLFHGPEVFRELLALRSIPGELGSEFKEGEEAVMASLGKIRALLEKLDPTLVEAAGRAGSKMLYQLRRLQARAGKAQLRRNREVGDHADWLSSVLFPNKNLQEREIAGVSLLARHGRQLLHTLYQAAQSDCADHQVIHV
ncbi:MAG: bacillithiol biosynthesis cysteine-adding enzyme BshC [Acidobacteriia bacterium]|nr:bacillithiol biosynthesis cysteine-adding enzyme BshC [Terriglobia bacterium]